MKRQALFTLLFLFGAAVGVTLSTGLASARWVVHDRRGSSILRVYENGMLAGFNYDFTYDPGDKVFLERDAGDQSLVVRQPIASGSAEDELPQGLTEGNFITPFRIIRWQDTLHPSQPLQPGSDLISLRDFGDHPDWGFKDIFTSGIVEECSGATDGPQWLVKDCRIQESAPAPSLYRTCSPIDLDDEKAASSTIHFPADIDIFDVDVSMHVTGISGPLSSSLGFAGGPTTRLFSNLDAGGTEIGDKCRVNNKFYGLLGHIPPGGSKHLQPGYALDDEASGFSASSVEYHIPEQPLASYIGRPAKGEWNLSLQNGTLECWCLDILGYRTVRFEKSNYQVKESDGVATVRVVLSDVKEGAVLLDYETIPQPGSNQPPVQGTVHFDSEAEKQNGIVISIPIVDDEKAEADEKVLLQLKNPSNNYGLSARSSATLTIENDDEGRVAGLFLPFISSPGNASLNLDLAPQTTADAFTWQSLGASAANGGLSDNDGASNRPAVVSDDFGRPYVAWDDESSGDTEIYLLFWDGNSWEALGGSASGGGISDNNGTSRRPALAMDEYNRPYVAWEDNSSGKWQIYVKRWNGSAWESLGPTSGDGASDSAFSATVVSMSVTDLLWDGENRRWTYEVYIAYQSRISSNDSRDIYVKQYDETSDKWELVGDATIGGGISKSDGHSRTPSIFALGDTVHVTWHDDTFGANEVYYRRWAGSKWTGTDNSPFADNISGTSLGNSIQSKIFVIFDDEDDVWKYIAWSEDKSGDREIYVKMWHRNNKDREWLELGGSASGGGISNNDGASSRPALAIGKDGRPHVVWHDDSSGNMEIYSRYWNGSSWVEHEAGSASGGGISKTSGRSELPGLALGANGVPYAAWWDDSSGNREIYFKWWQWWPD